jgi:serine/threonine protein kinase
MAQVGDEITGVMRYRLKREIATGGMGSVYEAEQYGVEGFVKTVAIKILLPELSQNADFVRMFIDEAQLVSSLVHQNIVQIYQLEKFEGGYYIAMEYIEGVDAEEFVCRHQELQRDVPIELATYIISRVCRGLEYAHNKRDDGGRLLDIVHRDVSPRNVMITNEGEVKLADFGVAKAHRHMDDAIRDNILVGKLEYMSPEQALCEETDGRSDIFSLGALFFDLLTGVRVFERDTEDEAIEVIVKGTTPDPRQYRSDLPDDIVDVLLRCLQRDPAERYQTAGELGYALEYYMYSGGYGPTIMTLAKYMAGLYPKRKFYVAPSRGDEVSSFVVQNRPSDGSIDQ